MAREHEVNRPKWLDLVEAQVESVQFGVVQIVIHDGRIVQIERTEKTRLDRADPARTPGQSSSISSQPFTVPPIPSRSKGANHEL